MNNKDAILIVGAGPTGLTLANDLARRKVPFKIIDSKAGPSQDSKGLAVNISSQYGLRLIGLNSAVGGNGMPISRLNLYWNEKRFSSINFSHLPLGLNALITQPQANTEQDLLHSLATSGHQVCWGCKLIDVQETQNRVHVRYTVPDHSIVADQFHYVVGCDGKFSVIRPFLTDSFAGIDYPMHFVLGDFCVDPGMQANQVHYFVYDDTFFILVPIAPGTWRIVVKYDGTIPDQPVSSEQITRIIARHFGQHFDPGKPLWISRAPFYNRVAGCLNSNRLFIAGDAAHLFSPIGGTGMNTGMQDAFNLGWKLAAVYHGISGTTLLDSYEQERLPAIVEAANLSDLSTRLITRQVIEHPVLNSLAPKLTNKYFLKKIAPALHSGIAQKIPLLTAQLSTDKETRVGQYHHELLFLLDKLPLAAIASTSSVTFWCFVSRSCINQYGLQSHALHILREKLQRYPECVFIYASATPQEYQPSSTREFFTGISTSETEVGISKDIVLVRPDGLIFYEADLHSEKQIISAIESTFYFSSPIAIESTESNYEAII
jgi:2-polyprenyl-6-methoxyphenol hydroxylase-like FAD-dependent oxidoreductase